MPDSQCGWPEPDFFFVCSGTLVNGFTFCPTLPDFITSKSFVSLKPFNITVYYLWASIYLAHANICSLATTLVSLMAVIFHA